MNQLTLSLAALAGLVALLLQASQHLLTATAPNVDRPHLARALPGPPNPDLNPTPVLGEKVQSLATYAQTTSRPLFFEGRRFPAREASIKPAPLSLAQVAATAPVLAPVTGLKLKGLQLGGEQARALIEAPQAPPSGLTVGATVQAWTVAAIQSDSVLLMQGATAATLELYGSFAKK